MSNVSDFIIENGVLTKYVGPGGDVVIPEGVFAIGYACFSENQDIKSVVIPEGVTEILTSAFADCPNLENATIAGSVVYLQNRSFAFCEKLKEVRMQEGIKHIGEEAFAHCTSLKKIVLPNSVKTMGNGGKMLYGGQFIGSGLEEITMPIGVEPSHGKNIVAAFAQCDNLRKITFTEGGCNDPQEQAVVHLSRKDSFRGKLPEVVYAPGCLIEKLGDLKEPAVLGYLEMLEAGTAIDAIIAEAYEKYIKAQKKKLYPLAIQNEKLLDHMIRKQLIPAADMEQLLEIAGAQGDTAVKALLLDYQSRSFSGKDMEQAKVKEEKKVLRMPTDMETLKKLWTTKKQADGTLMIARYKGQDEIVEIPQQIGKGKVTAVGTEAFKKNDTMIEVIIPASVVRLDRSAFIECKKLEKVTMENGLTEIGYFAFSKCKALKEIVIPDSVTSLGHGAFAECAGLEKLVLPQGLQTIPGDMVLKCAKLKQLEIPASVVSVEGNPFQGCKGLADKKGFVVVRNTLYSYNGKDAVVSVPEHVTRIGKQAFFGMKKLEKVILPDGVTCIGQEAFGSCENLKEIQIPNSVARMEQFAFSGCRSLNNLVIPDGITEISTWTFKGCTNLTGITIPNSTTKISEDAFDRCEQLAIHAHAGSYAETYAKENNIPFVAE